MSEFDPSKNDARTTTEVAAVYAKRYRRIGWIVLLLTPIVIGGAIYSQYSAGLSSDTWPTVTAKVVRYRVPDAATRVNGFMRLPEIEYTYTVDQKEYRSQTVSNFADPKEVESKLSTLSVGQQIEVRYCPCSPSDSVLVPGASVSAVFTDGLGYFAMAFLGVFSSVMSLFQSARFQRVVDASVN